MYFDAVITPVILGGPPGIIKPQTAGRKKLTKAQSRNDTDQPSPSRLTLGRPHTATPYSQPVSLSPPSQPRPRSNSNTLSRPPSLKKKKSMSFASLFFNRNAQPSRSNTGSSFIDIEEEQNILFKCSKTAVETGTPPASSPSRPRTHRLSRSFSSTPNYHLKDNGSNGQESLHSRPSAPFSPTPSPTMMRRFEHASKRSSESCTNIPRTKSPRSAFRQGVHGKGGPSAALPTLNGIDTDACCFDDDACSAISSICFADDPDEKPHNKGKGRQSRVASIATVIDDSPVTRLDRDSLVLDISASNRISVELGDITESEAQAKEDNDIAQTCRPPYRSRDKLLSILGEFPQQYQQTHQRRHSCSTASVSSTRSRWSTTCPPSSELSLAWALPDIPLVSPMTTTTFVPSLTTQPPTPTQSSPPSSSSSNPVAVKRKRRSTLLFPSADGITAFLRPLETSDTKRFSRPFRSSTFSSSSTPLPPFDLSVPPISPARTLVPQSHPSAPPGLNAHVQSCNYAEYNVESEDRKGKNRVYRDSVMTQDSTFSDLHRLPSSLLDDSLDSQSVRFNTAPSTPTLLSCASHPSLYTSSASESTAQSPALSFANTPYILNPTITISSSNTPFPTGTSTPAFPTSPTPPLSISPPRHPIRPLPQPPKSSTRPFPSLSRLNLSPTASTGIELVIDPVDSPFDPAVSPIVFASSDSDDYSFERYPGDLSDDDSVEIGSWGSQDGIEPLLGREKVGTRRRGGRKAEAEAKRKQRMKENSGWSSVRVPLRKKSSGLVQERSRPAATVTGAIHSYGRRETANWVGEWNSEIHDVIQQLRSLR